MKSYGLLIFISIIIALHSEGQVIGKFVDIKTKMPISSVLCDIKGLEIGSTNIKGEIILPINTDSIRIIAEGYFPKIINTKTVDFTFNLTPHLKDQTIKEVIIKNKIDEYAHAIVRTMMDNELQNCVTKLKSFHQIVYSKITMDAKPIDSIPKDTSASKVVKNIDTEITKYLKDNTLFVWERVFEVNHDLGMGDKMIVKSSKMSGIKNPLYEFIANIYKNNEYPNFLKEKKYLTYNFNLIDSVLVDDHWQYKISFYSKRKFKTINSLHGMLWVDKNTNILIKCMTNNPNGKSEYYYKLVNNKFYCSKFEAIRKLNSMQINNYNSLMYLNAGTSLFQSPHSFSARDFQGNEIEIARDLGTKQSIDLIDKYRLDTMSDRERKTFITLDTMKEMHDIEKKLGIYLALKNGAVKLDKVNLNIFNLINYNDYEGVRLGLGGKTNFDCNPLWSISGYLAYGFKDKEFKYGGGLDYLTNYYKNAYTGFFVSKDVAPSGKELLDLQAYKYNLTNQYYGNYFKNIEAKFYYKMDIYKYLESQISTSYIFQQALLPNYYYTNNSNFPLTTFQYFSPKLSFHYYPKSQYLNTPEGKFAHDVKPTHIYGDIKYSQGFTSNIPSFLTTSFKMKSSVNSFLGNSNFVISVGAVLGKTPMFNLLEAQGYSPKNMQNIASLFIGESFATMQSGQFYSDKQLSFFLQHDIFRTKIAKKANFNPVLVYSATLGSLSNTSSHTIPLVAPNKLYQETGVLLKNIFFGIGFGAFYRLGAYQSSHFSDNIAFRFNFSLN